MTRSSLQSMPLPAAEEMVSEPALSELARDEISAFLGEGHLGAVLKADLIGEFEEAAKIAGLHANELMGSGVGGKEVIEDAVAAQQSKELKVEVATGPVSAGSAPEMESLVGILLDNAFKYSPEATPIQVSLGASKDGKSAELRVSNVTRESVDPAQLSALFDRFYRADESRAPKTGGYGIGLAMAQAIVEAAGGTIAASAPGRSVFVIEATLPLQ
ncbi:sensor histidine kinase [Olsenella sp. KGMB02461]|nr:sensor histidine kinase [Olsenella sp. KGMB02461]